jgi:cell division septation protein DedD
MKIVTVSLLFLLCVSTFVLPGHLQTTEATGTNNYSNGTLINALYNLTTSTNWAAGSSPWGYSIPWTEYTVDMLATTIQTGVNTVSSVSAIIDNSGSPQVIIYWYSVYGIKLGLPYNQTAIEWALDNQVKLANGLPLNYGTNTFLVYGGSLLYVYYWANYYQYDLSKWNLNAAYATFKADTYKGAYGYAGVLEINGDNSVVSAGPRYYDEWGETARCFIIFYQMGVTDALNQAILAWNYWNTVDWNAGGYYQYRPNYNDFEVEAPFFIQDALMIQNYANSSLNNINRLAKDTETRYLASGWTSPQWIYSGSKTVVDHTAVHAYSTNSQHRLPGTLGAWVALYGEWSNLTNSDQSMIRTMILGNGTGNYAYPAWQYLLKSSLYDSTTNMFKPFSDSTVGTPVGTSMAMEIMLLNGIVPQTATLSIPLSEWTYESSSNIINPQLLSIDFNLNQLTIGIASAGTVTFAYGSTPFNYNFDNSGVYTLQFSSDWNGITGFTVSNFPNTPMNYFVQPTNSNPNPTPTPSPSSTPTPTPTPSPTPTPTPSPTPAPSPTPTPTPSPSPSPTPTPTPTASPSPTPTPTPTPFSVTIHVVNRNRNVANALVSLTLNNNKVQGYTNSLGIVQFTLTTNGNYATRIYVNNVLRYSGTLAIKPPYSYTISIH